MRWVSCIVLSVSLCSHIGSETLRAGETTAKGEASQPTAARRWPSWRGPAENNSAGDGLKYPADWRDASKIVWQAELPGVGCSTPIVWDERIFLTAPVSGNDTLHAYDWSGKQVWQTSVGPESKGKHRNGSGCNPTPVTDGRRIFAYFKSGNLAGFDLEGKLLWKTNLQERWGKDTLFWDLGSSPVLTKSDVVVAVMHAGKSYLAAFDQASGELHWKVDRNYETPSEGDQAYTTPHLVDQGGKPALIVWGAEHVTAHAADDGHVLWECGGFNPKKQANWVSVASAVVAGEYAIVPYGRGSHLAGVKLGGSGDVTATHRTWTRDDTGVFVPSPVADRGKVYLVRDGGEVECLDPSSGKTLWSDRFPKHASKFYATPAIADGKLYAPREDGTVMVAGIGEKFSFLAAIPMQERIIASPVPVGGRLLIRGEKHLFCIAP